MHNTNLKRPPNNYDFVILGLNISRVTPWGQILWHYHGYGTITAIFKHCCGRIASCYAHIIHLTVNSLASGKFEWNFRYVLFKWISVIDGWGISCEIALIWMSLDFTDDPPTLVQVMAWCRQATSHYLSLCWPTSLMPYGATRPQWVNWILHIAQLTSHQ